MTASKPEALGRAKGARCSANFVDFSRWLKYSADGHSGDFKNDNLVCKEVDYGVSGVQ